eukprot:11466067-Alexandrium_andersonii.AAC.1
MPLADVAARVRGILTRRGRRWHRETGVRAGVRSSRAVVRQGTGRSGQIELSCAAAACRAT